MVDRFTYSQNSEGHTEVFKNGKLLFTFLYTNNFCQFSSVIFLLHASHDTFILELSLTLCPIIDTAMILDKKLSQISLDEFLHNYQRIYRLEDIIR